MATNDIGTGTRNGSINGPVDFWNEIAQAAHRSGMGMGEFCRDLLAKGAWLSDPVLAKKLTTTLANYYPDKRALYAAALMALFTIQTALHWAHGDHDALRRASGRVRIVKKSEAFA